MTSWSCDELTGSRVNNMLWQPVPMLDDPVAEKVFPVFVVVFFFQYNQGWTSLPSIVLSRIRYAVCGA